MNELTQQEQYVVAILRELKPFERIEIIKDSSGRPDAFLVKREQKIMLSKLAIVEVR